MKRMRRAVFTTGMVFPLVIPPLRERAADIPKLVQHVVQKRAREMKLAAVPDLAPDTLEGLMTYRWPENVRELENAVERALRLNQNRESAHP
jgi:DNA-binding NtrC family response regulator